MSNDRDFDMERRLREALSATAEGVQPGGDGLMRIQERIGSRGSRWARPAMIIGTAVIVAAAAVGGVAIARHNNGNGGVTIGNRAPSHTPNPTANPASLTSFPAQGFFPFSDAAGEASWQQQYVSGGHSPWPTSPVAVSQSWVPYYLLQKATDVVVSQHVTASTADITMGRTISGAGTHAVVVVHLVKYRKAWIVVGASSPDGQLTISSPAAGSSVTSPVTVTGPGFGVDQRAVVQVRDAATPSLLGHAKTGMFGNGTAQWSASPSFTPSKDGVGVIVVSTTSSIDGGVGEITAEKVVFAGASSHVVEADSFYAVQHGQIEKFSGGGAPQGAVSDSAAVGPVSEVRHVGDTLYFTAGAANCADQLRAISTAGGASTLVATADTGDGITGFDVSPSGRLVYFEQGCGTHAGQGKLVFPGFGHGPGGRSIDFPGLPPVIVGDPVWESDNAHVDAFVRTGMEGYLARYDSASSSNDQPSTNACPGFDINTGLPGAVTTSPDGTLWFAVQTGTSMQVISCANGTPTVEMTVSGNHTPSSLSVDASGNILLADAAGDLWRGEAGGGLETGISNGAAFTSVTW